MQFTTSKMAIGLLVVASFMASCKKEGCTDSKALNYNSKAKKDDGSCTYANDTYQIPSTYQFLDANGNSTVNHSGQTERLNQMREMVSYMKTATTSAISADILKEMFANTNGNANGAFSFTSSKQLKDKCFELDQNLYESYMDQLATASNSFASTASNGNAGVLSTGTKTYLFDQNGMEHLQIIEKGLMGAVFMHQALNVYFSSSKMNVNNSTAVDPAAGLYYTEMEHHWDEAFGYFGVNSDFPTSIPADFWGKYSNAVDASLGSNQTMMSQFLKGRAAIVADQLTDRDQAIMTIRETWEKIAAYAAIDYLDGAYSSFSDPAIRLHELSEAYAFILCLRYAPTETRKIPQSKVEELLAAFGTNFWNLSLSKIQQIKTELEQIY